jgi:hypothetical protein
MLRVIRQLWVFSRFISEIQSSPAAPGAQLELLEVSAAIYEHGLYTYQMAGFRN